MHVLWKFCALKFLKLTKKRHCFLLNSSGFFFTTFNMFPLNETKNNYTYQKISRLFGDLTIKIKKLENIKYNTVAKKGVGGHNIRFKNYPQVSKILNCICNFLIYIYGFLLPK